MNIQKIAEFLLERRRRASPIVLNGEVLEAIESEGLQEALLRRWLVADQDTGNLQITSSPTHVAEMETVAKTPPDDGVTAESWANSLVMDHAQRWLHEISAPGTGKPAPTMGGPPSTPPPAPAPGSPAATPTSASPTPTAPSPATTNAEMGDKPLDVNDDVMVAQEGGGRAYRGKVSSRTPQGMRLSFGPEAPR